jgi:uncharacterized protein (TIGR02001 family)
MRNALPVAIAVALLASSRPARAEDPPATPPSPSPLIGSLSLASDYIFRGLSQTNTKPALQGGLEYDDLSGWYAGAWGSSISWLSDTSTSQARVSSNVELDFYAGYRGKFDSDLGYDVGLYTYYYPGTFPHGFTRANTTELYASLAYAFLCVKYSHALTNAFGFADTKNSGYLELAANYEFAPSWVLNAHVGHQRIDGVAAASYSDYRLGVTKNFANGFVLALAWIDTDAERAIYTNADGRYLGRSTALLSATKNF